METSVMILQPCSHSTAGARAWLVCL